MLPENANTVVCLRCRHGITFADIGLLDELSPGVWHVVWQCGCGVREHTGVLREGVIRQLLGDFRPHLPYTACPLPIAELDDASEEAIANVYVGLHAIDTADDFLELCEHATRRSHGGNRGD